MDIQNFEVISINKLQKQCDPFQEAIWGSKYPISHKEVGEALKNNTVLSTPYSSTLQPPKWSKKKHVERIAFLVLNPDLSPIEIDVGVPILGYHPEWIVVDGNHRLAAAIFRGDETISATCSGDVNLIDQLKHQVIS
jgi:hypothetical protein